MFNDELLDQMIFFPDGFPGKVFSNSFLICSDISGVDSLLYQCISEILVGFSVQLFQSRLFFSELLKGLLPQRNVFFR